ncbi:hypothetical protein KFY46_26905, partial [Salmonella enterica subsp. enterica serovar 1,4,[5],12:i:-]|nr:hypothetical protein [Salmonella enterica subsp. enterica serovar 1,4,[5],12:i:-]
MQIISNQVTQGFQVTTAPESTVTIDTADLHRLVLDKLSTSADKAKQSVSHVQSDRSTLRQAPVMPQTWKLMLELINVQD